MLSLLLCSASVALSAWRQRQVHKQQLVFLSKFGFLYGVYSFFSVIVIVISLPRPRNPRNAVVAAKIMRFINRMVGLTWSFSGLEHLVPDVGCVIVMNHQSSVDVTTLMELWSRIDKPITTPKRSILYSGPFGLAAWLIGSVFIDRASKAGREALLDAALQAKHRGLQLFVFPEGTRNGGKNLDMLPFKKGAFHVAIEAGVPVVPVVVSEYDFLDVEQMRFEPGHITVKVLEPIDSREFQRDSVNELIHLTRKNMLQTLKEVAEKESS